MVRGAESTILKLKRGAAGDKQTKCKWNQCNTNSPVARPPKPKKQKNLKKPKWENVKQNILPHLEAMCGRQSGKCCLTFQHHKLAPLAPPSCKLQAASGRLRHSPSSRRVLHKIKNTFNSLKICTFLILIFNSYGAKNTVKDMILHFWRVISFVLKALPLMSIWKRFCMFFVPNFP